MLLIALRPQWLPLLCYLLFVVALATRRASAFRPPKLSDELGCSPTLSLLLLRNNANEKSSGRGSSKSSSPSLYYFDPLGLARDENFARLREAELKHGRICMLAVTEIILIPILKRVSSLNDWVPGLRKCSESILFHNPVSGLDILKVVAVCGLLEAFVFWQKDPKDLPGDYGFGFFGVRDYGLHEDELVMELENGRLAMVGFVGFLASDAVSGGESWLEQWLRFFAAR